MYTHNSENSLYRTFYKQDHTLAHTHTKYDFISQCTMQLRWSIFRSWESLLWIFLPFNGIKIGSFIVNIITTQNISFHTKYTSWATAVSWKDEHRVYNRQFENSVLPVSKDVSLMLALTLVCSIYLLIPFFHRYLPLSMPLAGTQWWPNRSHTTSSRWQLSVYCTYWWHGAYIWAHAKCPAN